MKTSKFHCHAKFLFILTLLTAGLFLSQSTNAQMPHQHGSLHGGKLLMNGDDHFEIVRVSAKRSYRVFPSDKFRKALNLSDFEYIKITAIFGEKSTAIPVQNPEKSNDSFLIRAPKGTGDKAKFVIDYKRKNPPKDYVQPSAPLTIDLSSL